MLDTEEAMMHLVQYSSAHLKRVVRSTMQAETYQLQLDSHHRSVNENLANSSGAETAKTGASLRQEPASPGKRRKRDVAKKSILRRKQSHSVRFSMS